MKKAIAIFSTLAVLSSVAALAGPPKGDAKKGDKKPTTKVVDVWTCPMTKEVIKDHKSADKGEVVGNYRVHFCCGSCQPTFDKLTDKEKKEKIQAIVKNDSKKGDKKSDTKKG